MQQFIIINNDYLPLWERLCMWTIFFNAVQKIKKLTIIHCDWEQCFHVTMSGIVPSIEPSVKEYRQLMFLLLSMLDICTVFNQSVCNVLHILHDVKHCNY